jgi:hypothetical protein
VENAEKGKVSTQTIDELVAKALEAYESEIPGFLLRQARRLIAASGEGENGQLEDKKSREFQKIEIRKVDDLEQEVCAGYIMTDCPSEKAFAIVVKDSAMEPEIRKGAIAVLNPEIPPTEGTLVGAFLASSGTVLRRYSRVTGAKGKTLLTSPHPNEYPPLSCLKNELKWIHVVHSITLYL